MWNFCLTLFLFLQSLQEVPAWLEGCAEGAIGTNFGSDRGNFGGRDARTKGRKVGGYNHVYFEGFLHFMTFLICILRTFLVAVEVGKLVIMITTMEAVRFKYHFNICVVSSKFDTKRMLSSAQQLR